MRSLLRTGKLRSAAVNARTSDTRAAQFDRIVYLSVVALAAAVFVIYVANTMLYLAPPNPVKAQWLPLILAVQHPFFSQNWHLFAPNPVRSNFVVTVRCRTARGVTPWTDATQPLLARHHRDRSTPMSRLLRIQQNAVGLLMGRTGDEWRPLLCRRQPRHPICRGTDPSGRRLREMGTYVLGRVAAAACDDQVGRGVATAVQSRVLIHEPPPWSRRHESDHAGFTRFFLLRWMPHSGGAP